MFQVSERLSLPERSLQQLWRYLPEDRLLDILRTGELFFAHLPSLEDGREGALTTRTRDRLALWFTKNENLTASQAYAAIDHYNKHQQQFYVNCWHMNEHESYLMWKAYSGRGYAIRTSFERARVAFEASSLAITGGSVHYIDFEREFVPIGNVFNHVATKDMPYRDEREFRFIFWAVDTQNQGHPKGPTGVRIPVDVTMLIESIVVNPFSESMKPELKDLIEMMNIPVEKSCILVKPVS